MKTMVTKVALLGCLVSLAVLAGCGPSMEPTGPEEGSVQAYLDANPDVAARIDEDSDVDDESDDGTGE